MAMRCRVQGAVRILEDHLQVAAERAAPSVVGPGDVLARELDPAVGRRHESEHGPADGVFAGARFADDTQRLPFGHGEADAVDGSQDG